MEISHVELKAHYGALKQFNRSRILKAVGLLVLVFLFSLNFRTAAPGFMPLEAFGNIITMLKVIMIQIFDPENRDALQHLMETHPLYSETISRGCISIFTMFSGMALGLSGAVFQQVYRNPIASPSTIGATAGVNLGNLIIVLMFSYSAMEMIMYRYLLCIVLTIGIVVLIMLIGRFTGSRSGSYSVVEMLMFGSILSRMITSFNSYWMYHMNGSALVAYQEIILGVHQVFTFESLILFFSLLAAGIFILLKMRFRLNAVALDPIEMKAGGVNIGFERAVAQLLAALIIAVACIQCGDVGLFALVIPHVVRYLYGSDFRNLAVFSTIYGGIFLLVIRIVSSMIFLGSKPIPMTFIVSVIMIPIFMIILLMNRRGFD